jgi:hypothetical protein
VDEVEVGRDKHVRENHPTEHSISNNPSGTYVSLRMLHTYQSCSPEVLCDELEPLVVSRDCGLRTRLQRVILVTKH